MAIFIDFFNYKMRVDKTRIFLFSKMYEVNSVDQMRDS